METEKIDKSIYLDKKDCKELLSQKEIFIFATGLDAERATNELSDLAVILAYVDNYRSGEGHYFCGKEIISLEQCLKRRNERQTILVASYKYGKEICDQLSNVGLIAGIDFFVWDEMHIFSCDEATKNYIDFLARIWKRSEKKEREGIVIVPFYNRQDWVSLICSYYGNYFADKFNAHIFGYPCFGVNCENATDVLKKIYSAFNVETLINSTLDDAQQKEADQILNDIWNNLSSWKDWKNITVFGIRFGTTIIRHLLRIYIPCFDCKDSKMYSFLKQEIQTIVFWHHYIFEHEIKVILLLDGVSWDGYIRDIAVTKGIPTYILTAELARATLNYCQGTPYPFFKDMWQQLLPAEKDYGIAWAKEHIEKRLKGGIDEVRVWDRNNFAFAENKCEQPVLDKNDKLKLMICPHIFEEDCFYCGEQIFDDNYFAWLCHLGELSNQTPDYDWYLKMHPSSSKRDFIILDMILERYPNIKKIPPNISPIQLRDEGMKYALTVYGSIGHEYPALGIQVINAGCNPHSAFDFTWNPQTKEEYDNLIFNLRKLKKKQDMEGLYQFYSLNYLFYNWNYIPWREIFFENPLLGMDRLELGAEGKSQGTWIYEEYMKEWTEEKHEKIMSQMDDIFNKLDEWRPDILYRRNETGIKANE